MIFREVKDSCCGEGNSSECCSDSSCECESEKVLGENDFCPICKEDSKLIANITVKNLLKDEFRDLIAKDNFHLCKNPNCKVTYFNNKRDIKFFTSDTKVAFHFKNDSNIKMGCYCANISEGEIIKAVANGVEPKMGSVLKALNRDFKPKCKVKNPEGKCCTKAVKEAIEKGLKLKAS